ncbi:hypothetical protein [Halorubrum saccharovorum]|uniref:hypothetical protein n=1 Tax=Halorubrum saccharovorum TaxID=2248 RepID=UPI0012690439|nr:hypothetical protein [Halorubrum saccharovorum]
MVNQNRTVQYIEASGDIKEAIEFGVKWLHAFTDEGKQDFLLAVDTKRVLDNAISNVIGEGAVRELKKKNRVRLGEGTVDLATKRVKPENWESGPVLVAFPSTDLLDVVDKLSGVSDVLVITRSKERIESWVGTWGATNLRSDSSSDLVEISNPVAEAAVDSLDFLVNTSTGITHSTDRARCIRIFEKLQAEGIEVDPTAVRGWLIREKGWSPDHADDVKEIIEGVAAGKKYRYEGGGLADNIVEQWRKEAGEQQND